MTLDTPHDAIDHFTNQIEISPQIRLVAVGGPTAVGKSTLSRAFLGAARDSGREAYVLEGDRFLVPQKLRPIPASFPGDVYEVERFHSAVRALAGQGVFSAPFYERDGRHTGRLAVGTGDDEAEILDLCRMRVSSRKSELSVQDSGEVVELIEPADALWILDSELSLLYEDLRCLYDLSYGIRASRALRRAHFLGAVESGERYPYLTLEEAQAKIEGFWQTDDTLIEPTVSFADIQIVFNT